MVCRSPSRRKHSGSAAAASTILPERCRQPTLRRRADLYLDFPFAGNRMPPGLLNREGIEVGHRHVATLMKRLSIAALYRKPNTSKLAAGHKIYPYLLHGVTVDRPDQA